MEKVKELTLDDLIARLRCPLSGKLFAKPVIASNGCVYEENELVKYIEGPNDLGLSQTYKEIVPIQTLVNYIVQRYPELKPEQYKYTFDPSKFKRSFIRNFDKIRNDIANNRFENLLQYDGYKVSVLTYEYYNHVLQNAKENILSHFISTTMDINEKLIDGDSNRPLLNRAISSNRSTVRAIVKYAKNLNVNSISESDGWSVAHQAFRYNLDLDLIKTLISKGMKITMMNVDDVSAVEICMSYAKHDVISYILKEVISSVSSDMAGKMISGLYENGNISDDHKEEFVGLVLARNTEK